MKVVTIHNLHECTAQEVFDYVVAHVRNQGRGSYDEKNDNCYYRYTGPDGVTLACAAGVLLPDEIAHLNNDSPWLTLRDEGLVPNAHSDLIRALQNAHDGAEHEWFVSAFNDRVRRVAAEFGLTYRPPLSETAKPEAQQERAANLLGAV